MRRSLLFLSLLVTAASVAPVASAAQPIQITADTVTARDRGQTLDARGHVVITDGRMTLRADRVLVARSTGRIQLTGHVRITTQQGNLQAGEATVHFTRANALDVIDATAGVFAQSGGSTLRADRMTYQAKDDTLTAVGHLVLTSADLTITGQTLVAQRDTATVTGRARIATPDGFIEGDRLDAAVQAQIGFLRGNVVGVFAETRITAASATLFVKESKAVFRDRVAVVRPDRTMRAALVTYYYKEKRIVAEGQTTITIRQAP